MLTKSPSLLYIHNENKLLCNILKDNNIFLINFVLCEIFHVKSYQLWKFSHVNEIYLYWWNNNNKISSFLIIKYLLIWWKNKFIINYKKIC